MFYKNQDLKNYKAPPKINDYLLASIPVLCYILIVIYYGVGHLV